MSNFVDNLNREWKVEADQNQPEPTVDPPARIENIHDDGDVAMHDGGDFTGKFSFTQVHPTPIQVTV